MSNESAFEVSQGPTGVFEVKDFLVETYWILVKDSEFAFDLYQVRNGVAFKSDYSFSLYDVNGRTAVYCEFYAENDANLFPSDVIRFFAQALVKSQYPGIDCNAFFVQQPFINRVGVVIGSQSAPEFDPNGY